MTLLEFHDVATGFADDNTMTAPSNTASQHWNMDDMIFSCSKSCKIASADPKKQPQSWCSPYWHYSVNQLGCEDIAAQIGLIDTVKRQELRQIALVPGVEKASQELPDIAFSSAASDDEQAPRRYVLMLPPGDVRILSCCLITILLKCDRESGQLAGSEGMWTYQPMTIQLCCSALTNVNATYPRRHLSSLAWPPQHAKPAHFQMVPIL